MSGDHPPTSGASVLSLWPPGPPEALEGLYLAHDLKGQSHELSKPLVYANYVTSLDGRIALRKGGVPAELANPRDWWLFQELAVQADAILVSGRYLRARSQNIAQNLFAAFQDKAYTRLREWRHAQGLPVWPWIVVLSRQLDCPLPQDLPVERMIFLSGEESCTSRQGDALLGGGAIVKAAGKHRDVTGQSVISRLGELGVQTAYAVGGASLFHMLAAEGALSRLYLTRIHRLLGGREFTSLVEGDELNPALDLKLQHLYYDPAMPGPGGQLFSCYQIAGAGQ